MTRRPPATELLGVAPPKVPGERTVLGRRIEELRVAAYWTYADLARQLGSSGEHVRRVEAGANAVSSYYLARLAVVLRVSPGYLLGLTDDPRPPKDQPRRTVDIP